MSDDLATDRRSCAPKALDLSAADFRAVFDASPRPLLLMAADAPKFTMLAVNEAHARSFATTPEALQGWGVLEVFGPDPDPAIAGVVEAIRTSLERVLATRAPDQMAVRPYASPCPTARAWNASGPPPTRRCSVPTGP